MKEFNNVKKVICNDRENICKIEHNGVVSEVDVKGIMIEGRVVVRGARTEVDMDSSKCKKYGETLICKRNW